MISTSRLIKQLREIYATKKSGGSSEVKSEMHRYKRGKARRGPGGKGGQGEEQKEGDSNRPVEGAQEVRRVEV